MILQSLLAATLGCAPLSNAPEAMDAARPALSSATRPNDARPAPQIAPDDILGLVDIAGLSVSPDGRTIIYQLLRADPDADRVEAVWCLQTMPSDPRSRGEVVQRDDTGDRAPFVTMLLAMAPTYPRIRDRPGGIIVTLEPRWSPDSTRVAILDGETGAIHVCVRATSQCARLDAPPSTPTDLVWRDTAILLAWSPRIAAPRQNDPHGGVLVDDRFELLTGLRLPPTPSADGDLVAARVSDNGSVTWRAAAVGDAAAFDAGRPDSSDIVTGASGPMTTARIAPPLASVTQPGRDARLRGRLGPSATIWAAPADPARAGLRPPLALWARAEGVGGDDTGDTGAQRCAAAACVGYITELVGADDGDRVAFVRREGPALSETGLWLWRIHDATATRLHGGDDLITGCRLAGERIVCLRANATTPTQVVAIDLSSGALKVLVDPNATFAARLAPAEKFLWRTADGQPVFGWLLRGRTPEGQPLRAPGPLVIAQYRARGFLRGGVGDELPVQALAARGLSVLVVERPENFDADATATTGDALDQAEWRGLTERWRTLSAVEHGADLMRARGIADPHRIGLHGLSDGAETAMFALIHSTRFAVIATAGGAHEPGTYDLLRPAARAGYRATDRGPLGLAGATGDAATWLNLSVALNVDKVNAPLLVQSADSELLYFASTRRALEEAGKPFELLVFDNEGHVKRSPSHRRAIYWRNLDWFSFWIGDGVLQGPDHVDEARRWTILRSGMRPRS